MLFAALIGIIVGLVSLIFPGRSSKRFGKVFLITSAIVFLSLVSYYTGIFMTEGVPA